MSQQLGESNIGGTLGEFEERLLSGAAHALRIREGEDETSISTLCGGGRYARTLCASLAGGRYARLPGPDGVERAQRAGRGRET